MSHTIRTLALLPAACLLAMPAHAFSFNPFTPIFERLPLVTDFFGFLFLILRNWVVFATEVFPISG